MTNFNTLSEREILALAISLEEEDERVYADYAEGLKENFPASASVFEAMRGDESGHRKRLIELYRQKFGEHIPLIRRQDVKGFVQRKPVWLMRPLGLESRSEGRPAQWKSKPGNFTKELRPEPTMPVSASCWMTWLRRNVGMRTGRRS